MSVWYVGLSIEKKRKSSSYIVGLYRQHQRPYRLYHLDPCWFLGEIRYGVIVADLWQQAREGVSSITVGGQRYLRRRLTSFYGPRLAGLRVGRRLEMAQSGNLDPRPSRWLVGFSGTLLVPSAMHA